MPPARMILNDSIGLSRSQHAELYASNEELRLVVDHPSNAPLIGMRVRANLVRATALTVDAGDGSAVVYVGRGGASVRIATAKAMQQRSGGVELTDWWIEPGFRHDCISENSTIVRRIIRLAEACAGWNQSSETTSHCGSHYSLRSAGYCLAVTLR